MIFGKVEKVAVYIDGSNIYNKLKGLGIPEEGKRFDYDGFTRHLVGARKLISKRYRVWM